MLVVLGGQADGDVPQAGTVRPAGYVGARPALAGHVGFVPWRGFRDPHGRTRARVGAVSSVHAPRQDRLKPFLGDEAESLEALRLHVSRRTARLRQAGLDDAALLGAVQREILVLALHGYPREMMLQVWSKSRQYPAAAKLARLILGAWGRAFPGLSRPKPDWTWATPAAPQWEA